MNTILTAFLCAMLIALPAQAETKTQPSRGIPAAAVTQPTAETGAELKLQQQKIDFFKERLELQDKRIGDLGMILGGVIGLFGILITGIVVFFSFRSTREAVLAAKDEARKEIEQQAGKVIGNWLDREGKLRLEELLKPEIEAAIKRVHDAASPVLGELAQQTSVTRDLNQQHEQMMAELPLQLEKLTQSQIKKVDEDAERLESIAPKEYRSPDWLTLGIKAYHEGKREMAADFYEKAAVNATDSLDAAIALQNRGVTLGELGKNDEAIAVYDEVVKRYGEAPEAGLCEQVAMALFNKAVTLGELGKNDEAITVYEEVVRRYGDATETGLRERVAMALYNMGGRLEKLGKYERAIAAFNKVGQSEGDGQFGQLRMMARIKMEHLADARNRKGFASLREAKKFWQAGDEASAKSLLTDALVDIESVLACKPNWPVALGNQGYILFLQGQTEQAREILAKAFQLGGEELRQLELADADTYPLPQDKAFKKLLNSL